MIVSCLMAKNTTNRSISKSPSEELQTTSSINSNVLEVNPVLRQAIVAECDKQGLTLAHIVSVIKAATGAKRYVYDKLGDSHEEEDHNTQLKASLAGLELRGELKSKEVSGGVVNQFIDVKALVQQFNGVKSGTSS